MNDGRYESPRDVLNQREVMMDVGLQVYGIRHDEVQSRCTESGAQWTRLGWYQWPWFWSATQCSGTAYANIKPPNCRNYANTVLLVVAFIYLPWNAPSHNTARHLRSRHPSLGYLSTRLFRVIISRQQLHPTRFKPVWHRPRPSI